MEESSTTPKTKVKAKRKASSDRHYISDPVFYEAVCKYQAEVKDAASKDLPKPMVPDYIAQCLMMLARKYARKPGFSRYPYIEDMIGDAIMCCFKNIVKFDGVKYKAAFPYFTMMVHNSFVQRIQKEKTALYRIFKAIIQRQIDMSGVIGSEGAQVYGSRYTDEEMRKYCAKFEKKLAEKRLKSKERKKAKENKENNKFEFDDDPEELSEPEELQNDSTTE